MGSYASVQDPSPCRLADGTLTRVGVAEDESRKVKHDKGEHSAAAAAAAAAFHSPEESAAAVVSMIKNVMRMNLHTLFS